MKIENPFDEFPRRYGGRTTREKMGYRSYVEYCAEDTPAKWREKWEPQLWRAYQLMIVLERFCKEKDIGELHFIPRPSTSTINVHRLGEGAPCDSEKSDEATPKPTSKVNKNE